MVQQIRVEIVIFLPDINVDVIDIYIYLFILIFIQLILMVPILLYRVRKS